MGMLEPARVLAAMPRTPATVLATAAPTPVQVLAARPPRTRECSPPRPRLGVEEDDATAWVLVTAPRMRGCGGA